MRHFLVIVLLFLVACGHRQTADRHYRQGQLFEQQGRKGDAMREYRLAAGNGLDNSEYARKAVNAIGHLYLAAGHRDDALTQFRRSYDLAASSADTVLMVLSLRDMSRCLRSSEWLPSAVNCFRQADRLLSLSDADSLRCQLLPEWIDVLMQQGDTAGLAEVVSSHPEQTVPDTMDGGPMWLVLGKAHQMLGHRQLATDYFRRAAESDNPKTHASAVMLLSQKEGAEGYYESAWLSAMECVAMMDSVNRQTVRENGDLVSSLENQIGVERENGQLRLRLWGVALLALLALCAVVAFYRWRMRRLQAQVVAQSRRQEEQRLAAQAQNRSQQDRLLAAFRQSAVYAECERLGQGGSGDLSADAWTALQALLNEQADGFVNRLVVFYPKMKPAELRMCCLIRLGLGNLQISNVFHRTQQATTNARKRLFARMFDREGTAEELNQFLMSF